VKPDGVAPEEAEVDPADPAATAPVPVAPVAPGTTGLVVPTGAVGLVVVPAPVVVVPGVLVVVVVVVGGATVHVGGVVMVLASSVTAPFRTRTRPWTVAPVFSVAEVSAMMVPTKVLAELSVAELPTCQNTLQAWAPFSSCTTLFDATTRSDDAWKMKTEFGLPAPFSTNGLAAVMLAVAA
jgi:hypothetical protein